MKRLEIGPSCTPKFVGSDVVYLDKMNFLPNTIHWDLEKTPLPFADNSFDEVMASHVLEHISPIGMVPLMNELHRITKLGGTLHIRVPHFRFEIHSKSMDHKQFFNRNSIMDLCPGNGYEPYGVKMWTCKYIKINTRMRFLWNSTTDREGRTGSHALIRLLQRTHTLKAVRLAKWWLWDWNHLWIPAEIVADFTPIKEVK